VKKEESLVKYKSADNYVGQPEKPQSYYYCGDGDRKIRIILIQSIIQLSWNVLFFSFMLLVCLCLISIY